MGSLTALCGRSITKTTRVCVIKYKKRGPAILGGGRFCSCFIYFCLGFFFWSHHGLQDLGSTRIEPVPSSEK